MSSSPSTSVTTEISPKKTKREIKKELFENVMGSNWKNVLSLYEQDPRAYMIKITSSGHTALHVAICELEEEIVVQLVQFMHRDPDKAIEALGLGNKKGHTPLHLAAAAGNAKMCRCIISGVDNNDGKKRLLCLTDKKGETPLFRAVHYGRKEAFFYLHVVLSEVRTVEDFSFCRREDGQTILHDAIIRENFDLAFQIIHLYEGIINYVDKEKDSPLHALAKKSAAFPSGSTLRGRDKIVYKCVSVKELKQERPRTEMILKDYKDEAGSHHPKEDPTFPKFTALTKLLYRNTVGFVTGIEHGKNELTEFDLENREGHKEQLGSNIVQEQQCLFPASYTSRFGCFLRFLCMTLLFVSGYGPTSIKKIQKEKEKHLWASQVLSGLLKKATMYDKKRTGRGLKSELSGESSDLSEDSDEEVEDEVSPSRRIEQPTTMGTDADVKKEESPQKEKIKETAILVAAKHGIVEIVEKILADFSVAITDEDEDNRNILLLAVENRHLAVYKKLLKKYPRNNVVFQKVNKKGDTALHFAATYGDHVRPWPVPGAALQMQWEIKWHEFVENTMPDHILLRTNMEGKTSKEIFSIAHKTLVKAGGEWLTSMATSCSVVATLIATVAFASSTTIPGGTDSSTGKPTLENNPTFKLFAIASLIALCFSVTSLITFLAILTSRHQEKDFGKDLPRKILMGLTSLFVSIASMLVTFCAGHFLEFEDKFKYAAFPIYAVTLFPLCLFAAAQFPLYFDLLIATFWSPFSTLRILELIISDNHV